MSTEQATTWLVGDVGATNARFGLVAPDGAVLHSATFACADFAEIGDALDAYLAMRGNFPMPRRGALAIAALITGDQIRMTNHPWSFSMAAANERESAVLELMRRRLDHVSAERCLSGPGLVNLYNSLAALDRVPAAPYTAAQITDPDIGAQDPLCREATAMFCAMLGTVAGDLALTLGAEGGVYIAGGIVPRLGARFVESGFRQRFEAKGRLGTHLAAIPSYVVTHPLPAFLGCVAALS